MRKTLHPNKVQVNIYYRPGQPQQGLPLSVVINLTKLDMDEVINRGTHLIVPMPGCAPIKIAESLDDLVAFKVHWERLPEATKAKYLQKHVAKEVMTAASVEQQIQNAPGGNKSVVKVATRTKKATGNMPSGKDWPDGPGSQW